MSLGKIFILSLKYHRKQSYHQSRTRCGIRTHILLEEVKMERTSMKTIFPPFYLPSDHDVYCFLQNQPTMSMSMSLHQQHSGGKQQLHEPGSLGSNTSCTSNQVNDLGLQVKYYLNASNNNIELRMTRVNVQKALRKEHGPQ